jgi:hypothetical protein
MASHQLDRRDLVTLVGLIPLLLAATGLAMQRYIENRLGWAWFRPLLLTTLLALGFFGFIHYLFYFASVGFVYLVDSDRSSIRPAIFHIRRLASLGTIYSLYS